MIRVREIITVKYEMLICYQRNNWLFLVESEPCHFHLVKRNKCVVKTPLICLKINKLCCENSVCCLVEDFFILRILVSSLIILFLKRTVPLPFICVMGNGPINYNSCLNIFLRLTRILSPTLYWWVFQRTFLRLLLWRIRNCLRCRMCSQSPTCLIFNISSRLNTSCIGDACSVVW